MREIMREIRGGLCFDEDNEILEDGEGDDDDTGTSTDKPAEGVDTGEPAEPVEDGTGARDKTATASTTGAAGSMGSTDEDADPIADTDTPAAIIAWDGEEASIRGSEWFKQLPDAAKPTVLAGLQAKLGNYDKGYQPEYARLAETRKRLSEREEIVKNQEMRAMQMWTGEIDPLVAIQKEKEEIETTWKNRLERQKVVYDKQIEELQAPQAEQVRTLSLEAENWKSQYSALKAEVDAAIEATQSAEAGRVDHWLKETAPDIYDDDKAFTTYCRALRVAVDSEMEKPEEFALKMVRGVHPAPTPPETPQKPQPDKVPAGIAGMNMGSKPATATRGQTRSFDDIFQERMHRAQAEENERLRTWKG